MPAPPKFSDISKKSSSLLKDDFDFNAKWEIKSKLENGVTVKSTFTRVEKDSNTISGLLELKKSLAKIDFTAKVQHTGATTFVAEHVPAFLPAAKLKGEASLDGKTSKVSADYKHDLVTASTTVDTCKSAVDVNAAFAFKAFVTGVSSKYTYGKGATGWGSNSISAQYSGVNYELGATLENFGDKAGVSYHQKVSKDLAVAVALSQETDMKTDLKLTVGSEYIIDKDSSFKTKADSAGILSALYSQKIRPQTTIRLTAQIDTGKLTKENAHKIGIACLMDL